MIAADKLRLTGCNRDGATTLVQPIIYLKDVGMKPEAYKGEAPDLENEEKA